MHTGHGNLQTHIPQFIPFQLRPIRARVKGSLRGKDCRLVVYIPHHLFSLVLPAQMRDRNSDEEKKKT